MERLAFIVYIKNPRNRTKHRSVVKWSDRAASFIIVAENDVEDKRALATARDCVVDALDFATNYVLDSEHKTVVIVERIMVSVVDNP